MNLPKILSVCFILFATQFYYSCISDDIDCNCGDVTHYNGYLIGLELETSHYTSEGIILEDSVNKSTEIMSLEMIFETDIVEEITSSFQAGGFSIAKACTCAESQFYILDPIDSLVIRAVDQTSKVGFDVSENFGIEMRDGEVYLNDRLLRDKLYFDTTLRAETTNYTNIADSTVFEVKIMFESGEFLEARSELMKFY